MVELDPENTGELAGSFNQTEFCEDAERSTTAVQKVVEHTPSGKDPIAMRKRFLIHFLLQCSEKDE